MTLAETNRQLYETLISSGLLSAEQAQYWLQEARRNQCSLSEILQHSQVLSAEQWQQLKSQWGRHSRPSDRLPGTRSLPSTLGPYRVQEVLGAGGMGTVYKAYDSLHQRFVALKVLREGKDASESTLIRFLQEAKTAARIKAHPNIVEIFEAGKVNDVTYMAMEYLEGKGLEQLLQDQSLSQQQHLEILSKLADALEHIHQHGIIHRDIKPDNILIDVSGEPKLMDFGVAKDAVREESLTRTGTMIGTLNYMAPEQLSDAKHADHRADVYGLGAVFYEMLTGRPPHRGSNPVEVMASLLNNSPKRPRAIRPELSKTLERICLKAIHRQARARYDSVSDFRDDLDDYLEFGESKQGGLLVLAGLFASSIAVVALGAFLAMELWPEPRSRPPTVKQPPATIKDPSQPPTETTDEAPVKAQLLDLNVRDQEWLNTRFVKLRGVFQPADHELTINGVSVPQKDGRFELAAELTDGPFRLNIEATHPKTRTKKLLSSVQLKVDSQFPKLTLQPIEHEEFARDGPLSGQVQDPNLKTLSLDGATVSTQSGPFRQWVKLKTGENKFELTAQDHAGNIVREEISFYSNPRPRPWLKIPFPPRQNFMTGESSITLHGQYNPPDAEIKVNGQLIKTNEVGVFSSTHTLKPGSNRFKFTLRDGNQLTGDTKTIQYRPGMQDPFGLTAADRQHWAAVQKGEIEEGEKLTHLHPSWTAYCATRSFPLKFPKLQALDPVNAEVMAFAQFSLVELPARAFKYPMAANKLAQLTAPLTIEYRQQRLALPSFSQLMTLPAVLRLTTPIIGVDEAANLVSFPEQLMLLSPKFEPGGLEMLCQRKALLSIIAPTIEEKHAKILENFQGPLELFVQSLSEDSLSSFIKIPQTLTLVLQTQPISLQHANIMSQRRGDLRIVSKDASYSYERLRDIVKARGRLSVSLYQATDEHRRILLSHRGGLSLPVLRQNSESQRITAWPAYLDRGSEPLQLRSTTYQRQRHPAAAPLDDPSAFTKLKSAPEPVIKADSWVFEDVPRSRINTPKFPGVRLSPKRPKTEPCKQHQLLDCNVRGNRWINKQSWVLKGRIRPAPSHLIVNSKRIELDDGHFEFPLYFNQFVTDLALIVKEQGEYRHLLRCQLQYDDEPPSISRSLTPTFPTPFTASLDCLIEDKNLKSLRFNGQEIPRMPNNTTRLRIENFPGSPEESILKAEDQAGNVTELRIKKDLIFPKRPTLNMVYPPDNKAVDTGHETWAFCGRVEPAQSELSINGAAVPTYSGGLFFIAKTLSPGRNEFLFECKAGKQVLKSRRVLVHKPGSPVEEQNYKMEWQMWQRLLSSPPRRAAASAIGFRALTPQWTAFAAKERKITLRSVKKIEPQIVSLLAQSEAEELTLPFTAIKDLPSLQALCQFKGRLILNFSAVKADIPQAVSDILKTRRRPLTAILANATESLVNCLRDIPAPLEVKAFGIKPEYARVLNQRKQLLILETGLFLTKEFATQLVTRPVPLRLAAQGLKPEVFDIIAAHPGPLELSFLNPKDPYTLTILQKLAPRQASTSVDVKPLSREYAQTLAKTRGALILPELSERDFAPGAATELLNHNGPLRLPGFDRVSKKTTNYKILEWFRKVHELQLGSHRWYKTDSAR